MNFFDFFYRLNIYGEELFHHLKGWDDASQAFSPDYNQFPAIFINTAVGVLVVFLLYYYIINSPRLNRWWHWGICLFIVGAFGYLYARRIVMSDINGGDIAQSLEPYIGSANALMFGIYNMGLAVLLFLILTLLFRRWSKNCKHSPFVLLTTRVNKK